jgi:uncharacterized protein (TIGR02466 family)
MPTRAWFPTLVYDAPLLRTGGAAFARDLLAEARRIREHDDAGRNWCRTHYPAGYTSYATLCRLHRSFSTFMKLEQALQPHADAFARRLEWELGKGRLRMTDCWVNVMPRLAVHSLHLHPLSVLSGTYYVKTPRGCSSIRFEDPRLDRFMAAPPRRRDCRPEGRQHVTYEARAGNLILFESWLRHEVAPNRVAAERVSVSFNYDWGRA